MREPCGEAARSVPAGAASRFSPGAGRSAGAGWSPVCKEGISAGSRRSGIVPTAYSGSRNRFEPRPSPQVFRGKRFFVPAARSYTGSEQAEQQHGQVATQFDSPNPDAAALAADSARVATDRVCGLPEYWAPVRARVLSPGWLRTRPGDDCDRSSRPRSGGPNRRMLRQWKRHPRNPGRCHPPSAAPATTCPRDPRRNS